MAVWHGGEGVRYAANAPYELGDAARLLLEWEWSEPLRYCLFKKKSGANAEGIYRFEGT